MDVYLIDGTYELFRHYFAVPASQDASGQEIGATRGVLRSVLSMLSKGVTHLAVATDHVVESFRNDLYENYKTGEGVPDELMSQFPLVEESLKAMGVLVWPMVEFEADDGLAAGAKIAAEFSEVDKVFICTPDKDLSQSVVGERIVQLDRRKEIVRNQAEVVTKFGVEPESIPDYLALVGDTADGYPGLPGWGAKAAALVLAKYKHFEEIPANGSDWDPSIRNSKKLSAVLNDNLQDAILFRTLATLRTDIPLFKELDELRWAGPTAAFEQVCKRFNSDDMFRRATKLAATSHRP